MNIKEITQLERGLQLTWSNGDSCELPYIWLRDNDQQELHPDTHERTFDLTTVSLDIQPMDLALENDNSSLKIVWPNKETASYYQGEWLYSQRPGIGRHDVAKVAKQSWSAAQMPEPLHFSGPKCHESSAYLLETLTTLKRYGIVIINELPDDPMAGEHFGDLLGFKRETNYGVMFEVINKPDPNNLAYTALELPLHTDLSNQQFVPGNQFLHCYKNTATGGKSVFADGMAVIEEFEKNHPEKFQTLVDLAVPWRFIDDKDDIRYHRPVIGLDRDNKFETLTFNAHLADTPDFEPELMYSFYEAYQTLMKLIRSEAYRIEYQLEAGEMAVFDNQRVLHGRSSFDPSSGERHLRGYYVEHNEIDSRMRMLAANNKN